VIYGLTFLFGNIGPNTATFGLPTGLFPPHGRTPGHGIAPGARKIGAALSTLLFPTLILLWKASGLMLFLAGVAAAGLVVPIRCLTETRQRTREEASREWEAQRLVSIFRASLSGASPRNE